MSPIPILEAFALSFGDWNADHALGRLFQGSLEVSLAAASRSCIEEKMQDALHLKYQTVA